MCFWYRLPFLNRPLPRNRLRAPRAAGLWNAAPFELLTWFPPRQILPSPHPLQFLPQYLKKPAPRSHGAHQVAQLCFVEISPPVPSHSSTKCQFAAQTYGCVSRGAQKNRPLTVCRDGSALGRPSVKKRHRPRVESHCLIAHRTMSLFGDYDFVISGWPAKFVRGAIN
jgi:hypothetical protein